MDAGPAAGGRVWHGSGTRAFRVWTDPTGAFQLRLPAVDYAVSAERDGFFALQPRAIQLWRRRSSCI
jgi:hypothetical protein